MTAHRLKFGFVANHLKGEQGCVTFFVAFLATFFSEKKFAIILNDTLLVSKKCVFLPQNFAAFCCCNLMSSRVLITRIRINLASSLFERLKWETPILNVESAKRNADN